MIKWNLRYYILISILYLQFININCEIEDKDNFNELIPEYYNYQLKQKNVQIKYLLLQIQVN